MKDIPSIQFRQPYHEIHFPNVDPIENWLEMPQETEVHCPNMTIHKDIPISFPIECVGDGLEEQFQILTPPILERERERECVCVCVCGPIHNLVSNGT